MAFVVYLKYYEFDGWNAVKSFKDKSEAESFAKKEKARNERVRYRVRLVKNLDRVKWRL